MTRTLSVLATIAAGLTLAIPGSQSAAEAERGPKVGTKPPAFSLVDQKGERRDLASLLPTDDGHLAVVFFRSADW